MTRRRGEWRGEQLSAIDIEHLLKSLSTKTSTGNHTKTTLDEIERMSFHVLAGTYSEETFYTLTMLDKSFPSLKNMQNPEIYFKMSPLMTSLFNGNFIYANFLLDLGVNIEARDSNGKNILLHAATANHIANYRDPETVKSFQLEKKLESLFGQSQTITEDELQTFERIFALKDWFQSMDTNQKYELLSTLHSNEKYDIFKFLIKQWQKESTNEQKLDILMAIKPEDNELFCVVANCWRDFISFDIEKPKYVERMLEMGFFSKPEIKSVAKLPVKIDPGPKTEASAAIVGAERLEEDEAHPVARPNSEIATKSGPGQNKKAKGAAKVTSHRK